MKLHDKLFQLGACREALEWNGDRELPELWIVCERPDWMLWLAGAVKVESTVLVRLACLFARDCLAVFEKAYPQDGRPRQAIIAAESWCLSPTNENARAADAAADAAYAAADAAARAADAAADAAARAADAAARAAAYAAAYAAARAAAYAAADAAARAADVAANKKYCDMIRNAISVEVIESGLNKIS